MLTHKPRSSLLLIPGLGYQRKVSLLTAVHKTHQRWLRDINRNKSFVKIVADTRSNGEVLIAESEDFIFLYNNKSKTLDHWWMKRGRKAVTE